MTERCRLRIKDPSGAEFEAEGPLDFIQSEKSQFLEAVRSGTARRKAEPEGQPPGERADETPAAEDLWKKIIAIKGGAAALRVKSPETTAQEAALIILAGSRALGHGEELSAITLARALRSSGYQPHRLDRALNAEIKAGKITASGTKRNRSYSITRKGMEKIYGAIARLTRYTRQ